MILQEPMTALNPVWTIGDQMIETIVQHENVSQSEASDRSIELLRMVGIPVPERRMNEYPHQFSGGMRQRAMIAIALSCRPKVLLADEPTTALDVTIQDQIIKLVRDLQEETGTSVVWVTHDLGVVAQICDLPLSTRRRRKLSLSLANLRHRSDIPPGCPFRRRCPLSFDRCAVEFPRSGKSDLVIMWPALRYIRHSSEQEIVYENHPCR